MDLVQFTIGNTVSCPAAILYLFSSHDAKRRLKRSAPSFSCSQAVPKDRRPERLCMGAGNLNQTASTSNTRHAAGRSAWARRCLTGAGALACILAAPVSAHAIPESGIWYDNTGKGAVEIAPCGQYVCGSIVWLQDNRNESGEPLRDIFNPDPALRKRPICNLQVLGRLTRQADGSLDGGWVYDPKTGKSYNVQIRTNGGKQLIVRGYTGLALLGKSFTWVKAPADLPKCNRP